MEKLKKISKNIIIIVTFICGITFTGGILYGCYWLAKTGSYSFFYEDMVIKTITQQVKPESLK